MSHERRIDRLSPGLILFLVDAVATGGFGLDDRKATAIYGLYTTATYLMALPGGWLADRLGNAMQTTSTCWVAHGGGAVVPAAPKRGETVRVRLTGTDGKPLPATTPVTLSLAERNGALGGSTLDVVGEPIGVHPLLVETCVDRWPAALA